MHGAKAAPFSEVKERILIIYIIGTKRRSDNRGYEEFQLVLITYIMYETWKGIWF
jgi:hypothetical protein